MKKIKTPKISEILREEYMIPLHLSAYRLAKDIGVSSSHISNILHDKTRINAEISIRLGRYFGVNDKYFLAIQSDIDIRKARLAYERIN